MQTQNIMHKICAHCGAVGSLQRWGKDARRRVRYRCNACSKTSTNRTHTLRSGSHLSDTEWRMVTKVVSLRSSPSGVDLGRLLGRSEKTGQAVMRTLRQAMPQRVGIPTKGTIECDETTMRGVWIGGGKQRETGMVSLMPMMQRSQRECHQMVAMMSLPGSTILTDEWGGYQGLRHRGYRHYTVCHAREFVSRYSRRVHTNGIESVWGHAKTKARHTYRGYPLLHEFLREVCFQHNFSYTEREAYLTASVFRPKTNTLWV